MVCQDCSYFIRCFYKGRVWNSKVCDKFEQKPLPPYDDLLSYDDRVKGKDNG